MKVFSSIVALCVLGGASAFAPMTVKSSGTALKLAPGEEELITFPTDLATVKIEGDDTLRTWKMPVGTERVEYLLKTDGRPLKARVEMWLGPLRKTHAMDIDNEDGNKFPFRALLKFKHTDSAGPQMLCIRNTGPLEFPIEAGLQIVSKERNKQLDANTKKVWTAIKPTWVQGGAIRTFPIPENVDSVQIVFSSKAVGSKSTKAKVEILQGPNNKKQEYDLHVSGGSQPYHAVFETPGTGVTLRVVSKQLLEFPTECTVVPYEINGELAALPDTKKAADPNVERTPTLLLGSNSEAKVGSTMPVSFESQR